MARPKYALKKDANHNPIVEHLEAHGVEVVDCSKAGTLPDLLTLYPKNAVRGRAGWIEAKRPKYPYFTWAQLNFIAETAWPVCFVQDKDQALQFAKTGEGYITHDQKIRLAIFLSAAAKGKLYTLNEITRVMNGEKLG